jgi:polyhydroxyalkanoate synthase
MIQPNKVHLKGEALDLRRIRLDIYAVGAEKDHIVPWSAAWRVTQLVGGRVRFVLASSGHIAGMINPPGGKGTYWSSESQVETPEEWRKSAERHDGSWWTDWAYWLAAHAGEKAAPPSIGSAAHPRLQDAPGSYVLER